MKSYLVFSLLSIFLIRISVATSEAAIDDNWANDDIFSNTYSDLDSASTPDAGLQGSMWDENLITDADSFAGTLADADTGCSQNIGPSGKRRRNNFCASPGSPADLRLSLPQSPFETLESKNGINFNLDTIRFPGGTPQMTQMDNIYCGNQNFVVCDSGRVNDKSSNGNGKYRLQNVKRVHLGSLCVSPYSIWCCENYFPESPGDGQQDLNGAQQGHDALNNLNGVVGGLNDFGLPDTSTSTSVQTVPGGDVADSCTYFVTLP